ncbi:MAG: serine hydrolase, partial [Verrucomicrobiales bacterium]|nr:serine hydrolase [Verrucomicrobiales bacterium]
AIRLDTSVVVFAKNIDEKRPVASTQKLLTALLIAEAGDLEARVAVQRTDGQVPPRNLWITQGSSYRRGTLLEMMLVRSFNDVTKCLARDHAGSQAEFARRMNTRATELGMKNSHFVNAHGLTAEGQYSTARDMMRLAYAAWSREEIRQMVGTRETTFTYEGAKTIPVKNSNDLLHSYPECNGMKTGFTEAAGRCLVASASRGEKTVLAVILGSTMEDVWNDAETILKISLK